MMRPAPPTLRRGMAMLLVLAALVIGVTAAVGAARVAVDAALVRKLDASEACADDAMAAAEARIGAWLLAESSAARAAPDSPEPAIAVERTRIATPDGDVVIRVTAYDQRGMLPWATVAKDEPLARACLAPDVRMAISRVHVPDGAAPGVDLVAEAPACPRWPRHAARDETAVGGTDGTPPDERANGSAALAALVASHAEGTVRINLNTAPMALLEAVETMLQRDVAQAAHAARAAGRSAGVSGGPLRGDGIVLTGTSDLWSFRVDVECGPVVRTWWLVYRQSPDGWKRLQRMRIEP